MDKRQVLSVANRRPTDLSGRLKSTVIRENTTTPFAKETSFELKLLGSQTIENKQAFAESANGIASALIIQGRCKDITVTISPFAITGQEALATPRTELLYPSLAISHSASMCIHHLSLSSGKVKTKSRSKGKLFASFKASHLRATPMKERFNIDFSRLITYRVRKQLVSFVEAVPLTSDADDSLLCDESNWVLHLCMADSARVCVHPLMTECEECEQHVLMLIVV